MKKILLLVAAASLIAAGAQAAQRKASPALTAGVITLSPTYCFSNGSTNDDFLTFAAGIRQLSPLKAGNNLYLGFGADLEWMLYTGKSSVEQNIIGVKVPLSLVYRYKMTDEISFFPFAGLHASGYLFGNVKTGSTSFNVFDEDDMFYLGGKYNRLVLGAQIGVKATYDNILFGIGYEHTLTDLMPETRVGRINFAIGFIF